MGREGQGKELGATTIRRDPSLPICALASCPQQFTQGLAHSRHLVNVC